MTDLRIMAQTPRYALVYSNMKPMVVHNLVIWDKKTNDCYAIAYRFEQKSLVNRLTIQSLNHWNKSLNDKTPKKILSAIYDVVNMEYISRQSKDFMLELVS